MENKLKALPYTVELDWNSGNIFLNIPSIDSKLVLDIREFESIKSTIKMSENRAAFRTIKQGDVFYVGSDPNVVQYKILDVTSPFFSKFKDNIEIAKEVIEYVSKDAHTLVNVCVNHSKEATHVFICNDTTKEVIFGRFVVAAMILDGEVQKIIAKPFNEMNTISGDGSFLYKRL